MRYFVRNRDDFLALWTCPPEKIELFLMFLNSIDSNLQLTMESGGNEICFLDLKLTLKDNKIQSTVSVNQPIATYIYNSILVINCHLFWECKKELL